MKNPNTKTRSQSQPDMKLFLILAQKKLEIKVRAAAKQTPTQPTLHHFATVFVPSKQSSKDATITVPGGKAEYQIKLSSAANGRQVWRD